MIVIVGVITALNFILILYKLTHNRKQDGITDLTIFIVICSIFSIAGQGGIYVGMIASFIVSIYLYFRPPDFREIFR